MTGNAQTSSLPAELGSLGSRSWDRQRQSHIILAAAPSRRCGSAAAAICYLLLGTRLWSFPLAFLCLMKRVQLAARGKASGLAGLPRPLEPCLHPPEGSPGAAPSHGRSRGGSCGRRDSESPDSPPRWSCNVLPRPPALPSSLSLSKAAVPARGRRPGRGALMEACAPPAAGL